MKKLDVTYYPGKDYRELFDITINKNKCQYNSIGITNDGILIYIKSKLANNSSAYWTDDDIFSIDKAEFCQYLKQARLNGEMEKAIKSGRTTEEELMKLSK